MRWVRDRWLAHQQQREAHTLAQRAIPDELWLDTLRQFPFLRWRSTEQLLTLRRLSTLFLAHKAFSTLQDLVISDAMAVAIAAQACVPIVALAEGLEAYDGVINIVVSPDEVLAHREWMDDDGVVHTSHDTLSGEAMAGGPVLLSWRDVDAAGDTAPGGYNVVVHEFIHVLDMADGQEADGLPLLPDGDFRMRWQSVMTTALARHQRDVEDRPDPNAMTEASEDADPTRAGLSEPWLDPYGAASPEEFFAVTAEAFFVAPRTFQAEWPEVYALLREYFHQDPARFEH